MSTDTWTNLALLYVLAGLVLATTIPHRDVVLQRQRRPDMPTWLMFALFVVFWLPGGVSVAVQRIRVQRARFKESQKWRDDES